MTLSENPQMPEGFDEAVRQLKEDKAGRPAIYDTTLELIRLMASGHALAGIREERYPDWGDADFEALLAEIGEPEESPLPLMRKLLSLLNKGKAE